MTKLKTKSQALKYLYDYIPNGKDYVFPAGLGLKRTVYLLKQLGEPQNKLRVIHIAGTSGKGSTSFLISSILTSLGFKVGLSVSPHLLDIRERFQINNQLISEEMFYKYLNEITPAIEKTSKTEYGAPTYFEILVSLSYYIFYKEHVNYAVMETGLGGTFDGTNVVDRSDKIAVITKIGHDHTAILGKTLYKIASQKAGIIQQQNKVITINQHPNAMKVIEKVSMDKKSELYLVDKHDVKVTSLTPTPNFSFKYLDVNIKNIELQMLGSFQIQNCSLALATVILLSQRDKFFFDTLKVKNILRKSLFLGRMQKLVINNQTLIIDGAHNPQKMAIFIKNLRSYFPNQKFNFVIALKRGKDYKNILRYVVPLAKTVIITSFFNQTKSQGMSVLAEDPKVVSKVLDSLDFKNYSIYKDTKQALKILQKDRKTIGVVTGSLYLLSEIYPIIRTESGKLTNKNL